HVEQIRAIERGELVAVCDQEPLMAQQLGVRMNVAARYTDLSAMLDEARLNVLHIATPPASHVEIACAAMEAGCHVFVEKPFAPTAADAKIILDCAQRTGRRLSVNYLYNFEPPALELQTLLDNNALGEIVHLDTGYGYNLAGDYGMAVMADPNHWVHRLPGKLFHNVLDHVMAKLVAHLGDEFSVDIVSFRRRPPSDDAIVDAMPDELRFLIRSGRVTASGLVSAHARPVAQTLKVFGTLDTVELDYTTRTLVRSARQTQQTALGRVFPAWTQARRFAGNGWRNLGRFRRHEFHYFECMRVLLARFYDAVEGRGPDPIPHDQILRVARLIDRIVDGMEEATA
ncbi:MAG: Gfo/Idh/MocA family oxidoreductase, partial [Rhodanobacteraceae bacterium]